MLWSALNTLNCPSVSYAIWGRCGVVQTTSVCVWKAKLITKKQGRSKHMLHSIVQWLKLIRYIRAVTHRQTAYRHFPGIACKSKVCKDLILEIQLQYFPFPSLTPYSFLTLNDLLCSEVHGSRVRAVIWSIFYYDSVLSVWRFTTPL